MNTKVEWARFFLDPRLLTEQLSPTDDAPASADMLLALFAGWFAMAYPSARLFLDTKDVRDGPGHELRPHVVTEAQALTEEALREPFRVEEEVQSRAFVILHWLRAHPDAWRVPAGAQPCA